MMNFLSFQKKHGQKKYGAWNLKYCCSCIGTWTKQLPQLCITASGRLCSISNLCAYLWKLFRPRSIAIFILCLFVLSGCSFLHSPNNFRTKDFDEYKIKRVAVFPFYNRSNTMNAGEIVTKAFIGKLYDSGKFEIEFPGNVKKFIVGERIIIRKGIGADHIKLIGKRLNVDAVIIGCVKKYESEGKKKNARIPVISVDVRMIHTDSCSILWIGQNYSRGDDYETLFGIGRIRSLSALSRKLVNELIDTIP